MRHVKVAAQRSTASVSVNEGPIKRREDPKFGKAPKSGLCDRKKARLRQQIVGTALHLFRQRGYKNTRVDDIVHTLEMSQPTFFRYSPSKHPVLREVGRRAFARQAESLTAELSIKATTEATLAPILRNSGKRD